MQSHGPKLPLTSNKHSCNETIAIDSGHKKTCVCQSFQAYQIEALHARYCISLARSFLYKSNCFADRCFDSLNHMGGTVWHLSNTALPCAPLLTVLA